MNNPSEEQLDQWIEQLLLSEEATPTLSESSKQRIRLAVRRKQQTRWAIRGIACAASLAVLLLLPHETIKPLNQKPLASSTRDAPVAQFVGAGDTLVVPVDHSDPSVTIVRVYPTTLAPKHWPRPKFHRKNIPFTQGGSS